MKKIPFGRPMIGDREKRAIQEVLDGPILVHGPRNDQFEKDFASYTQAPHAVSVSSCTAAMHLAYFGLGLQPGDEVIVPAQTHTATAHAVEFTGAKPVFVDAEGTTGNIDLDEVENKINDRTRAIAVVHFLGMPVDMDRVMEIASRRNLFILEDAALAIGTTYRGTHAGLLGDVGCFSFYPIKHLTTAEGGMIISRHADVAGKAKRQRAFGLDRTHMERKVPGMYDVNLLGFNYRMNEIQAALGSVQLSRIGSFLEKRSENYHTLQAGLRDIDEVTLFQSSHGPFQSSYYCLSAVLCEPLRARRHEIVRELNERGVGTSVYYPRPVPHMSYYRQKYGFVEGEFPIASSISYGSVAFPVGPHLGPGAMQYIVDTLKTTLAEIN